MNIVAGELSPRKKRRLLALDDDRSWLDAMKALLEQAEDLDVDVADNAQLATDRASSNNYDIVTADVRIDRFNRGGAQGDEWMLKQLPLLRSARKAIVTAYPGEI